MQEKETIEKVGKIYQSTISELNTVLIGQENVKKVIASALLCDTNSRILLTGNTGTGKTTLSKFLASGFSSERISVTSDMIPGDVQEQLKRHKDMQFLQVDEFNRASGKVQSAFIELFAEKQLSIGGEHYSFDNFYVLATQNSADISGIFNVPQAVYDRFDVNVYFESLSDSEKRQLLFGRFEPKQKSNFDMEDFGFVANAVSQFQTDQKDENLLMNAFELIDTMTWNSNQLFAGSNIRAHKFALKLAKLTALANGRGYILPPDIAGFINYLYMHRIDQNVAQIGSKEMDSKFYDVKKQILKINRKKM